MSNAPKLSMAGLILVTMFMGPCPLPPFSGGIRMVTYEALEDSRSAKLPVAGVIDTGSVFQILGSGTGSDENFIGFTESDGVDDHPNALTNADWSVSFDFRLSIPVCGTGSQTGFVPIAGAEFDEKCLL
jgi:hypothetical protein